MPCIADLTADLTLQHVIGFSGAQGPNIVAPLHSRCSHIMRGHVASLWTAHCILWLVLRSGCVSASQLTATASAHRN